MSDLYSAVVGQDRAVAALKAAATRPVHAYLLVGPPGVGRREAALAFAASLLCDTGGCGQCSHCRRALAGLHPDVLVTERTGAALLSEEAAEIVRVASLSPTETARKVIVLEDAHLAGDQVPKLLKTIEEPPPTTLFVILADHIPAELVTIASRCVVIEFGPIDADVIAAVLTSEGVSADDAAALARASGGRLDRARVLAQDPEALNRHRRWADTPARLDGLGHTAATTATELLTLTEAVVEPIRARQEAEFAEMVEMADRVGRRPPTRKVMDVRFNREQRRARTDELRSGLATMAATYRDRLHTQPATSAQAIDTIADTAAALDRNPNEPLLLNALLVRLSRLG